MTNYENLPGVISEVRDYNLGNIQTNVTVVTDSVLILGTAIDGPTGVPMPMASLNEGFSLFGDFKDAATGEVNNATLMRGAAEAYKAGCRDIRLLRITGKKAKKEFEITGTGSAYTVLAEGRYEGSLYNNVEIKFDHTNAKLTITKPSKKLTDYERTLASGNSSAITMDFNYGDFVATPAGAGNTASDGRLVDLLRAVNKQPNNNVVTFKIVDADGNDVTTAIDNTIRAIKIEEVTQPSEATKLEGGDDEIAPGALELYKRLGGYVYKFTKEGEVGSETVASEIIPTTRIEGYENSIYDLLSNYKVDIIVPMDVAADTNLWQFYDSVTKAKKNTPLVTDFTGETTVLYSTDDNFARQLAHACAVISAKTNECIGIIGTTPSVGSDLKSVKNKVNALLGKSTDGDYAKHVSSIYDLYLKNDSGQKVYGQDSRPIDIGGYLSIVACPELVFSDDVIGLYASPGTPAYSGIVAKLNPEYSTTNRKVEGIIGLRYELSGNQLNELTGSGYVTFRTSYDQGAVVTDGITAASPISDFGRLTTKRITNAAMSVVRKVCEPFIGLPNNLPQRNAITTAIQAGLDSMKQAGAIQDAWFEFYSSKVDQRLGNAIVDLTIIPVFEFRKIRVYVNLKNPV